jgi:hypothetical protein
MALEAIFDDPVDEVTVLVEATVDQEATIDEAVHNPVRRCSDSRDHG